MEISEAERTALFRLAEEAVAAIRAAKEIVAKPSSAVDRLASTPVGADDGLFHVACFDWSRLDPKVTAVPDISEIATLSCDYRDFAVKLLSVIAGVADIECVPKQLPLDPDRAGRPQVSGPAGDRTITFSGITPVPHDRRRVVFRFGGRLFDPAPQSKEVDLLDDRGKPTEEAVVTARDWAASIVELGTAILQPDRPQFAKLIHGASPRAVAARECLLRAWPQGLTGGELEKRMLELDPPRPCSPQELSQRVLPELRRLGAEIENRPGVGYYLVPIAPAK
jgi:hypothetical protein